MAIFAEQKGYSNGLVVVEEQAVCAAEFVKKKQYLFVSHKIVSHKFV